MIKLKNYQDVKNYFTVPDEAIDFLASVTEETENGRYHFGEGCFVNVMNYTTKEELGDMEAHDVYVDVQCLYTGEERIYYTDRATLKVTVPLNEAKDVLFYAYEPSPYVDYLPGECVILYPEEAHLPGRAISGSMTVKKAVMKLDYEKLRK